MVIEILDGNSAAAWAARLSRVKAIPCFPITPQTEMIETFAKWIAEGEFKPQFEEMESEHSVLSAALGASATGARTFTATSSQGLLLMHEILPNISGMRLPVVLVNVSRGLSAPITLWSDHNDILAMRDVGWLMFVAETNQEVLDSVIIAFKVSENPNILLPSLVNMDGFVHSYTRTEVDIPSQKLIDKFLPPLKMKLKLDVKKPVSLGVPAMKGYMEFRAQVHRAQLDAVSVIDKAHKEWYKLTGRKYDFIDTYKLEGADAALVVIGANTTIVRAAADALRKSGLKVGLLRIRVYRPFPEKQIAKTLKGIKKIGVIDQNIAPGLSGILYPEVKSALYGSGATISNYITALGGNLISQKDFESIFKDVLKAKDEQRKWLM